MDNKNTSQQNERRITPSTDLDLQLLVTNPVWGKSTELTQKVKKDLKKIEKRHVKKGDIIIRDGSMFEATADSIQEDERNLWEELQAIYTRDLRLGNLSKWDGQVEKVKYYIDLAGDFLQEGFREPFFKSIKNAITELEISQSTAGFLRNRQATFTHEAINKDLGAPKRNLLGMAKSGDKRI